MNTNAYQADNTALLFIDPYNDFVSEGGKFYPLAKPIIDAVGMLENLRQIVAAAREAGIRLFYVPHHRALATDFADWKHPTPYQLGGHEMQIFAEGSWGGSWREEFKPQPGDITVKEHWSSGFAGTDLDLQLRQRGVEKVILIGMLANTCIEATGRYGMELGYHVTLVTDATAAVSAEAMRCAHEINGPTYAHVITTTAKLLPAMKGPAAPG